MDTIIKTLENHEERLNKHDVEIAKLKRDIARLKKAVARLEKEISDLQKSQKETDEIVLKLVEEKIAEGKGNIFDDADLIIIASLMEN